MDRHSEDWRLIRFVLWLPEDDVEHVAQHEVGSRQVETPEPQSEGPVARLSKIDEEPSDLPEGTLLTHDEPNWEAVDLEAAKMDA